MSRILMLLLAGLIVVSLASAASGKGGGQPALGANWQGFAQHSAWIEQEDDWPRGTSCLDANGQPISGCDPRVITNPFGSTCFWSVNDHEAVSSLGYLDPGGQAVHSKCVVSDYDPVAAWRNGFYSANWNNADHGYSTAWVQAKSAELVVTVCFQPQGRCFTALPRAVERAYEYTFCGVAHYGHDDPAVVEIAGSNGGHGVVTTVTTTVTNPTGRRVRDVFAQAGFASDLALGFGWSDAHGCGTYPAYTDQADYPFFWTMS